MITEVPYNEPGQPESIQYQSVIKDEDTCIGFRRQDGTFTFLLGDMTTTDMLKVCQDALHDLESSQGLVHDGRPEETFTLEHASLERLRHVVKVLTEAGKVVN